jgi:DNA polymerase III alpha subunit
MISSHLFLQPRSAFREAAKVHGLSNEQISRLLEVLALRVHALLGPEAETAGATAPPPGFPLEPARWPHILSDGRMLLGRPHHLSIHPGGVVITPGPIEDHAPLERAPKGIVITQFEKDAAELLGLVKIDLLGNRALSTVDEALRQVVLRQPRPKPHNGTPMAPVTTTPAVAFPVRGLAPTLPLPSDDDPPTVALLQRGDTVGVNQIESPAMRHLLVKMKLRGLHDVIQSLALIRPGAASIGAKENFIRRRRGLEPVRHHHPLLAPVLGETQGLMLYEDDALRVVQALAGSSAMEADRFRKRISRHRTQAEAQALQDEFVEACARQAVTREVAMAVWLELAKFNRYSFCKSHAVSYGLIAWQAAWLKVHYPLEFWTAALNNNQGMYPRRVYVEALKRDGVEVRLPCVNRSSDSFTIEDGAIRTGLEVIATLDEEFRSRLLEDRRQRGPFRDLADLRRRLSPGPETLQLLIACGALDFTCKSRPALYLEADLQDRLDAPGDREHPRLFPDDADLGWSPSDFSLYRRLQDEWNVLGFMVGQPVMTIFRPHLDGGLTPSCRLRHHVGQVKRIAGLVATSRHTVTTDGRPLQFITLEDEWGLMDVTIFPGECSPIPYLVIGPYEVTGVVEEDLNVITVTAHCIRRVLPRGA